MVFLAFSLQHPVEKYGGYVGIASFFGLAMLSLLYFAQAREVKRLREWAGRAPERAAEVEAMAVAHAEQGRSAPAPPPPAAPAPAPAAVAPGGGGGDARRQAQARRGGRAGLRPRRGRAHAAPAACASRPG